MSVAKPGFLPVRSCGITRPTAPQRQISKTSSALFAESALTFNCHHQLAVETCDRAITNYGLAKTSNPTRNVLDGDKPEPQRRRTHFSLFVLAPNASAR